MSEEQELPLEKQLEQEQLFKRLRKQQNDRIRLSNYLNDLADENLNPIKRRYAEDMIMTLIVPEESQAEAKRLANEFWNTLDARQEASINKINFLKEAVEYLRELVVQAANPQTGMSIKNKIVREVSDKDFVKNVRARITDKISEDLY